MLLFNRLIPMVILQTTGWFLESSNHGYFDKLWADIISFPQSTKLIKLDALAFSHDCKLPWSNKTCIGYNSMACSAPKKATSQVQSIGPWFVFLLALLRLYQNIEESLLCYLEKFDFLRGLFSEKYSNGLGIINDNTKRFVKYG